MHRAPGNRAWTVRPPANPTLSSLPQHSGRAACCMHRQHLPYRNHRRSSGTACSHQGRRISDQRLVQVFLPATGPPKRSDTQKDGISNGLRTAISGKAFRHKPRHDACYKQLFDHAAVVQDLISGFIAPHLSDKFNFSTLEKVPSSYVSNEPEAASHRPGLARPPSWQRPVAVHPAGIPVHGRPAHGGAHADLYRAAV